jgi:hypothetical protein
VDRRAELLPAEYFHVVFTLPEQIASLAFYNKEAVYGILFHATAQTLLATAAQRLGVELSFFCVLHSCGQNLHFHRHLHCVVPGGGLSPDHQRWIAARRRFLLPVKVLTVFIYNESWQAVAADGQVIRAGAEKLPEYDTRHNQNLLDCIRNGKTPAGDIALGHAMSSLVLMGNISWRVNRHLRIDAVSQHFIDDADANRHLGRTYRKPWSLPSI